MITGLVANILLLVAHHKDPLNCFRKRFNLFPSQHRHQRLSPDRVGFGHDGPRRQDERPDILQIQIHPFRETWGRVLYVGLKYIAC